MAEQNSAKSSEADLLTLAKPIEADLMLSFTGKEILPQCLAMIDTNSELVYRCADILISAVKVMGPEWTRKSLLGGCLISEVSGKQGMSVRKFITKKKL